MLRYAAPYQWVEETITMLLQRVATLYVLALRAVLHRLRHDLAREIVVLLCTLMLLATFLYVFNDFLNVQVSSLSQTMRSRFAAAARVALAIVTIALSVRLTRAEWYGSASIRRTAMRLGEAPAIINTYLFLRFTTMLACLHGLAWWAAGHWLAPLPSLSEGIAVEAVIVAATLAMTLVSTSDRRQKLNAPRDNTRNFILQGADSLLKQSRVQTLVQWRLRQLLWRNRSTRLCLALALPFLLLVGIASFRAAPTFVAAAAAHAAGYLMALAIAFQMAEDLNYAWLERGLGVAHIEFIGAYERLSWRLALILIVAVTLLVILAALMTTSGSANTYDLGGMTPAAFAEASKAALVGSVPLLIAPWLLLQIDGRRPAIGALTILIVGLFVGTAVLAHWLSLLLLPLLRYYTAQTQDKRFYRA